MSKFTKQFFLAFAALGLVSSAQFTPVMAGDDVSKSSSPAMVVELFTSQGCSSCPPANEFVGSLQDDEDKLVLSYGVTYWDYLGWKDTFGDPEHTQRQKAYGAAMDIGFVYTPQIVLNGRDHDSRYTSEEVKQIKPLLDDAIDLDIMEDRGNIAIYSDASQILLVTFTPGWQEVDVKRGENHGRKLKIANVVEEIDVIKFSGTTQVRIEPGKAYAALVHDPETLQLTAAKVLRP